MSILTTIPNGASMKDVRDTLNSVIARLMVLEGVGTPAAPANTAAPAITGTAQEGQVLTVSNGTWSGSPTSYAYQWKRGSTAISGAINATRTLTAADVGAVMTCTVTATNATGSTSATSAGTAAVGAAPVAPPANSVAPAVTGSNVVGSLLTSDNGTWANAPTSYAYAWRRNGVDIAGATGSTYTLVSADAGTSITCRVSATNAGGTAGATSNAIAAVAAPAPSLSLSSAVTQAEGNSGTASFVWTLTLNRDGSTASYPFSWAVTGTGGNPTDAADFGGTFPTGTGTFAPGETSKSITVLVAGDTAVEPSETFLLTVSAAGLNTVTSTGTISNDDATPTTLPNFRTALVAAQSGTTGPLVINVVGDSTIGGTPPVTGNARADALNQQLGTSFAAAGLAKNGADLFGFNFPVNTQTAAQYALFNTAVTPGGWTFNNNLVSIGGNMWNAQASGADLTWTAEGRPFNKLVIYYAKNTSLGTFKVLVDGTDMGTISTTTAAALGRTEITVPLGTHSVAVRWVSGSVYMIGMETIDTTNLQSVRVRNLGQGSAKSADIINNTQPWTHRGMLAGLDAAHLHVIEGGVINDWIGATATATVSANLTTMMTAAQTKGGDVLLLGPTRSNTASYTDASQQAQVDVMAALANGTTKVFYDVATGAGGVGKYATMSGLNRMLDNVHPNAVGYAAEAAAIYGAITA